jgi:hypothetical protein
MRYDTLRVDEIPPADSSYSEYQVQLTAHLPMTDDTVELLSQTVDRVRIDGMDLTVRGTTSIDLAADASVTFDAEMGEDSPRVVVAHVTRPSGGGDV